MNQCRIKHHDCQRIKYICLDKHCDQEQKIGCADCFLEFHVPNDFGSHHRRLISEFEVELKGKIEKLASVSIQPICNNSEKVDQQFDNCMNNLIQKLTDYKEQIKQEINNEKLDFLTYVNEFNQKVDQKIDLQNTQISQLSTIEINKSISFYQNTNHIINDLRKDQQELEMHKKKLNQKNQKLAQKLRNTFEQIMKEFHDHNNNNNHNNDTSSTPEKQICPSQFSSTTQSTPTKNIVDVARSKKQKKGKN
ncbi:unnamed protein product (macronuclear) [Paramecium tetraurelia]|uniref:B box-type domain-containing protein n=1 Tax=Paramecium tetraurelia TaxID=5888 RepID=A0BIX1_PARTE|nr:uncharacterized protein GSPATT00004861001 [Paramecium tetraurelia]CAK58488.1 unnamed protein product [Paramecium tetraurelia]|eukprot:XP_001425886.1 hypothetical protein (macronuclear) [Paramecium tetraurelia strain d4-2]